jgi:hypothetical protein
MDEVLVAALELTGRALVVTLMSRILPSDVHQRCRHRQAVGGWRLAVSG